MDSIYLVACGVVWRKTRDPEAGLELIEGLRASNPVLRSVAESMLVHAGAASIELIEQALASGALCPNDAVFCMVELIRKDVIHGSASVHSAGAMTDLCLSEGTYHDRKVC